MATYAQRATAIADATLNRTATPTEIDRAAKGLAYAQGGDALAEYLALTTNAQRAEWYVRRIRTIQINAVMAYEGSTAGATAQQQAASQAATDLAETP